MAQLRAAVGTHELLHMLGVVVALLADFVLLSELDDDRRARAGGIVRFDAEHARPALARRQIADDQALCATEHPPEQIVQLRLELKGILAAGPVEARPEVIQVYAR